jgi:hypothetical protein
MDISEAEHRRSNILDPNLKMYEMIYKELGGLPVQRKELK